MNPRLRPVLTKAAVLVGSFAVVWVLIRFGVINDYLQATMATICINIILAVSLNLITGFTGQFSLGHAGFMSLGAYSTGIVTMTFSSWGIWGFFAGLLLGGVIAAIVGFLIGLPTLRLRGDYLAIATLGMAEIIRVVMLNLDSLTNGAAGLIGIPRFVDWTWLFVFTAGTVIVISNFIHSRPGRDCIAVREDEIAASSIGVNAVRAKTLAFVVGAFFGGIGGGLYASYFYVLKPELFGFLKSIDILVIVVLGGLGSLSGSVLAAILLALVSTGLQSFPELRMVIYGLILVIIMVFRPQGLMGDRELSLRMLRRLVPGRREVRP